MLVSTTATQIPEMPATDHAIDDPSALVERAVNACPAMDLSAMLTPIGIPPPRVSHCSHHMKPGALRHHPKVQLAVGFPTVLLRGRLRDQVELAGTGHGFGTVGRPELVEDVAHVSLHCVDRDYELVGDLPVSPPRREEA
jgi:hypothetical protein